MEVALLITVQNCLPDVYLHASAHRQTFGFQSHQVAAKVPVFNEDTFFHEVSKDSWCGMQPSYNIITPRLKEIQIKPHCSKHDNRCMAKELQAQIGGSVIIS